MLLTRTEIKGIITNRDNHKIPPYIPPHPSNIPTSHNSTEEMKKPTVNDKSLTEELSSTGNFVTTSLFYPNIQFYAFYIYIIQAAYYFL